MSRQAIAYVEGLNLADVSARLVFLAVAKRASTSEVDEFPIMGLHLWDRDIPVLADECGMGSAQFRDQLRSLKKLVRMDILEHADGLWEIVFGPSYTEERPVARDPLIEPGPNEAFFMPGWEHYSRWGYEKDLGYMYAQIIANTDDRDAPPRIWITPPRHVINTVDDLAAAIAEALRPFEVVPPPAALIKTWMKPPP